jgi:hypothetical protein
MVSSISTCGVSLEYVCWFWRDETEEREEIIRIFIDV